MSHAVDSELDAEAIVAFVLQVLEHDSLHSSCPAGCCNILMHELRGCHSTAAPASSVSASAIHLQLTATDLSDGNMNHVWLVHNTNAAQCGSGCTASSCSAGRVVVKQALPHIRILPTVPMTSKRAMLEAEVLRIHSLACGSALPRVLHVDGAHSMIVQEYLRGFTVLKAALIASCSCTPPFAATCICATPAGVSNALAKYVADAVLLPALCSHDGSHTHAITPAHAMQLQSKHGDTCASMCDLTREVWFRSPFTDSGGAFPHSRTRHAWTDCMTTLLRAEGAVGDVAVAIQRAVQSVQRKFDCIREAVIHGDLHTASMMVSPLSCPTAEGDTHDLRVIDAEFGHVGWAAMDTGTVIAHYICAFLHATARSRMDAGDASSWWRRRADAISHQLQAFWTALYHRVHDHIHTRSSCCNESCSWLHAHAVDAVRVAGVEVIRRVAGIARIQDFNDLPLDVMHPDGVLRNARAGAECRALHAACILLQQAEALIPSTAAATALANVMACVSACDAASVLLATPEAVAPVAFHNAVHIAIVFKSPVRVAGASETYIPAVKTRLRAVPQFAARPELLEAFATACVLDLVQRMTNQQLLPDVSTILTLLHAVPTPAASQALREVVEAEVPVSPDDHRTVRVYEPVGMPLSLTTVLSHACLHALRLVPAPLILIGADAPFIPMRHLQHCLAAARSGKAHVVPAEDGGFVALGLPVSSLVLEATSPASMFQGVRWSCHSTCASLCACLRACGIEISVSSDVGRDVDDADDWQWLSSICQGVESGKHDLSDSYVAGIAECARVRACVRKVNAQALV